MSGLPAHATETPPAPTRRRGADGSWIDEQAAEYDDLMGSFVDSVMDTDTDQIVEYQLIWEGGDLGLALTNGDNGLGVSVSRTTGKGFPFGIKNVGPGDFLLSINMEDMTKKALNDVVAFLQECDLPATLKFKKNSPSGSPVPPNARVSAASVPRTSTYTITSPTGSAPPRLSQNSSKRSSVKQQHSQRGSHPGSQRAPSSSMRMTAGNDARTAPTQPSPPKSESSAQQHVQAKSSAAPAAPAAAPPAPVPMAPPAPVAPKSQEQDLRLSKDSRMSTGTTARPSATDSEPVAALRDSNDPLHLTFSSRLSQLTAEESKLSLGAAPSESSMAVPGNDSVVAQKYPALSPGKSTGGPQSHMMQDPIAEEFDSDEISPAGEAIQPMQMVMPPPLSQDEYDEDEESKFEDVTKLRELSFEDVTKPRDSSFEDVTKPRDSSLKDVTKPRDSSFEDGSKPSIPRVSNGLPVSELHALCAKGNVRGVVQQLKVNGIEGIADRDPNHGQTCLHAAAKSGNTHVVKLLLEQYKPIEDLVNLEDDKGNTALHFAAAKTPYMVMSLLENGATANVKNSRRLTPLIISVITSREDNVIIPRMLLKFGANPNDMHEGQTVIHTAIGLGLLKIAGALVRGGAKMDVEDGEGHNVFEKLDRKSIRFLVSHIYFPPTFISEKERNHCMLCKKNFTFGHRKYNCTHCGRLCCFEDCAMTVEMYKFPMGFPGRLKRGAAVHDPKRVCKTCCQVFKEREGEPKKQENRFIKRIVGVEWDEINPNKLEKARPSGRRGEKDYYAGDN